MIEYLPMARFIARRIHERLPRCLSTCPSKTFTAPEARCLRQFDPSKHVLFRTYAQFRIRGAILTRSTQ
jgi:RNA polymerase sigma factor FliA